MRIPLRYRLFFPFIPMLIAVAILGDEIPEIQTSALIEGNTAFALDLYARISSRPGNVFFSPYSISTSMAAIYAGARGNTEKQIAQTFHFPTDRLHSSMGLLKRALHQAGEGNGIDLTIADALWTESGHPFLADFLKIAEGEYQTNLKQVRFKTGSESAREEINRWISLNTREKIRELLPPNSLDSRTKMVLANAIYFKGTWSKPFAKSATRLQPFHLSPAAEVRAAFMHQLNSVHYLETADFQAVELPYGKPKQELSMLILLPRQIDGCGPLESRLNPALLHSLAPQFKSQIVDLYIPRFKIESSFDLKGALAEMGMPAAFTPAANFSGIDGTHLLQLSLVMHKAWCDVNEEGTEAAAATVVGGLAGGISGTPPPPPPLFRADHPFIFLIRAAHSGSILFMGRMGDPTK